MSASRARRSALNFSQCRWCRVTSPSNLWHLAAALSPRTNASAMATSSSVTFGGFKAPWDLTRSWMSENLAARSTLMKLVDGRWLGERYLRFSEGRFLPESWGYDPRMTSFSIAKGQSVRLPHPPPEKGQMLRSCLDDPQSVAANRSWLPPSPRPSTLPSLALYEIEGKSAPNIKVISTGTTNTLGKNLKDQKAGRSEKEIIHKKLQLRLPVTRLTFPPLGALHRLNCLSHKLGDGPGPVVLTYVKLEVTGRFSLLSCGLPKGFLTGLPSF
ncbi:LOW QUALITY PROTEIN: hypothetical protein Cgig2_011766 [Carnegiea gigantea]|uniref:Uncharacterized protein n=1 Tax=Carnegiea gigantea TaxID=171969 RepID=A0A9Q1GTW6_9CARY|nr:LOW QUALITY PROTEIN: hypothetical protein Cgig2_011766 [Carnegiea gigantea]